jgi:hypothetical protein
VEENAESDSAVADPTPMAQAANKYSRRFLRAFILPVPRLAAFAPRAGSA